MTKSKINPESWYTLSDIVKRKMFPWCTSFLYVRKAVACDAKDGNILKAEITGKGRGKKYHFKGENIITFVNQKSPAWTQK